MVTCAALIAQRPADVDSSDRHTVKPWFNSRIAQSPRVVDLAADGFPLVGARIDVIGTNRCRRWSTDDGCTSSACRRCRTGAAAREPPLLGAINGYNVVSWSSDGTTYWAVSDLDAAELETFAQLFRAAPPVALNEKPRLVAGPCNVARKPGARQFAQAGMRSSSSSGSRST